MRIYNNKSFKKLFQSRTSFHILNGSLTVEAAIALPVFIYACMALASIIIYFGTYVKVEKALYNVSINLAKYGYAYETVKTHTGINLEELEEENLLNKLISTGIEVGTISYMVMDEIGMDYIKNSCIENGIWGMNFLESDVLNEDGLISIVVSYRLKNPYDILGLSRVDITQSVTARIYKGDHSIAHTSEETQYVYVTENGSVYHLDENCTYIKINAVEVLYASIDDYRNSSGGKYYACEKCGNKNAIHEKVLITKYGNRYHCDKNCSELKRCVLKISINEVGDRRPCSKCGGG